MLEPSIPLGWRQLRHRPLRLAVAVAGVEQRARGVDAEVIELALRPAASPGGALELMLGGELAAGAVGDHMALEIGLAAEQPKAVLDLPVDGDGGLRRGRLCAGTAIHAGHQQKGCEKSGRSRKRCARHGLSRGQCRFVAMPLRRK